MGAKSRNKGNAFELKVAKIFSGKFGLEIRRTPLSGGWARGNPHVYGDLVCIDRDVKKPYNFMYCVECKCVEGWSLQSLFNAKAGWFNTWWAQLIKECPDDKIPLLVFSKAFAPIMVAYDSLRLHNNSTARDPILYHSTVLQFLLDEANGNVAHIVITGLDDLLGSLPRGCV